jgi:hypothetical protein
MSSQAMDMKKIAIASHTLKNHSVFDKKVHTRQFHASKLPINLEQTYKKIDSIDKATLNKLFKNANQSKVHYFNAEDIRVVQNGVIGGAVGTQVGFWGTYIALKGAIHIACKGVDLVAPGAGIALGIFLDKAAEPTVIAIAHKAAIVTGIAAATVTGPV